jgi:hypothetical protein
MMSSPSVSTQTPISIDARPAWLTTFCEIGMVETGAEGNQIAEDRTDGQPFPTGGLMPIFLAE